MMNKKRVDRLIPYAYEVLKDLHICEQEQNNPSNWVVDSTYKSYFSSFGAAVTMGSLISAAAFFAAAKHGQTAKTKELVLDTAVALKLALNLYPKKPETVK